MQKGKLSNYSSAVLALLGILLILSLILSYRGVYNLPGSFLWMSFSYSSFYIPIYLLLAAFLAFKIKFEGRWVILLTLTILPFLTTVLFLKVFLGIDSAGPADKIIEILGRRGGAFLLFLLAFSEIFLIYLLSLKTAGIKTESIFDNKGLLSGSANIEEQIPVDNTDQTSAKITEETADENDTTPAVLRNGHFGGLVKIEMSSAPTDKEIEPLELVLPDLPALKKLQQIGNSYMRDQSSVPFNNENAFSPEADDEEIYEYFDEPEDDDLYDEDPDNEGDLDDTVNPEDDLFAELGDGHLIDTDAEPVKEPVFSSQIPVKQNKKLKYADYNVPSDNILNDYPDGQYWVIDDQTRLAAEILKETLEEFKIMADVTGIKKGPVITMFEILPAPGVKLSKIANLADNIAMRLAASRIRIVAPIPGKHAVGIEIPNKERAKVSFKEMLQADKFQDSKYEIPLALGKDITGNTQIIDLVSTPHLLIAGATGSGKSVCVNSIICSILYKRTPDEVRLLLIDPKIVELKFYNDIPHLLTPVITEPKRAFQALQYCIYIMEQRYILLDSMAVRDIKSYNKKIIRNRIATKKLPYIVVVVDEFADLIATSGKELESILARLAAMARAVGIHLVLATQRPSIDVITGLIKANIPSRIAFMVSNKIDSRIILDQSGADKLLGQGDMLFSSAWDPALTRIQGAFLSDAEVEAITDHVKTLGEPDYIDDEIFYEDDEDIVDNGDYSTNDPLMDRATEIVVSAGKASASYLQRRLQIGYNRAARIVEEMEARGIVGPSNGSKPREIIHVPDMGRREV